MIDYLILGGGSAGCVLAARLSEDAGKTVCLVEAGRNISQADMPAAIRSRYPGRAYLDTTNIWQRLTARMSATAAMRRYEQARVLGGGSAINALMANRGAPADYDEWHALGAHGWNWTACLPYFRKLETDCDFGGELHGTSGPLRVQRASWARVSPFVRAVLGTLDARGHRRRDDQNGVWEDGTFIGAIGVSETGERIPTSVCYLDDTVRARTNLTIVTDTAVERVLFDGKRAIGALLANRKELRAAKVIVCAGAIHSPALLLRSGIGPAADLAALGIDVIADRGGVGGNLMEHPSIAVSAFLPPAARTPFPDEHHEQAVVRFSSGLPGTVPGDMHGAILSRSGWHSVGHRLGTIFFWVNKSYSRGRVKLTSANPLDEPAVDFNMLSDPRDLERLKLALRFGAETLADPLMARHRATVLPTSYSPRVASVAVPGLWNAFQRGLLAALLDIAGPLRAWLVRRVVTQGVTLDRLLADDDELTRFVTRSVGGTWHPSGTCRMGAADDPLAVCDARGAVLGVDGLYVCDASLMPSIPCANTNVPTIMIAERIADMLRGRG
ncbi:MULTISPECIES: GMC family oxidoreductase N-terminal domain-containing protein [unclassified Caballeronia]|uniref:GMC family oxidoreductase n=1 Tax=unclassified Caballeronia TaxID=2646786 RepID=UPI00285BD646|nr:MULTISPECIES: GMC oxidoreductase [unclassified Caballeronia]MDR5753817.1 GMC family oxidoreductase N-terminal domain-containing protein [Caballeronia sp. LZ024]MDR5840196.1 GMC family oxidoreductase N-terminal domain-containing protein [Caballeronia sp. LZ031]